eukprot:971824-Pyramimonas_sp.AAC.1
MASAIFRGGTSRSPMPLRIAPCIICGLAAGGSRGPWPPRRCPPWPRGAGRAIARREARATGAS